MPWSEYQQRIIDYYSCTENAYKDSWNLEHSLAIHYGYYDETVTNFAQSLQRMNEVMAEAAAIQSTDRVLDAGCGIGGSCFFLAENRGCTVVGISLSERQILQAKALAVKKALEDKVQFEVMDYCQTHFPDNSFDIVWGCESICYAENKEKFIKESFRLLKPGGKFVVADGFVTDFQNNQHPIIRKWLDGWQVNYLETPRQFRQYMQQAGFHRITYKDISGFIAASSWRLYKIYFLASLYLFWKTICFSNRATPMQKKNIMACKYQYKARKAGLWEYGLVVAHKP